MGSFVVRDWNSVCLFDKKKNERNTTWKKKRVRVVRKVSLLLGSKHFITASVCSTFYDNSHKNMYPTQTKNINNSMDRS